MDRQPVLTQISTMDALMSGGYDPVVPVKDLHRYGDFGIGTYERLDGEMVMLNDTLFQILLDGTARTASIPDSTPFAVITRFQPDTVLVPGKGMPLDSLKNGLGRILAARGVPCAVRISGSFENIRTRSVPPQAKPYPPLDEVVASRQKITDTAASTGDAVGTWFPPCMKNINVPGFHMHFISGDRKTGGHLFDCVLAGGRVELQTIGQFHMIMPPFAAVPAGADTDPMKKTTERAE
jgi:acetolactate decarboxylase